jgi:hypothetical protein
MLAVELDMTDSPVARERGLGWSTPEQWQALEDGLLPYGGLHGPVDVSTAFTTTILERAYTAGGQLIWP